MADRNVIRSSKSIVQTYTPGGAQLDSKGERPYLLPEAESPFLSAFSSEPRNMVSVAKNLLQFHPLAYLGERGKALERTLSLNDIPNSLLDRIKRQGFDAIWMTGLWDRGQSSRKEILRDMAKMNALRHHVPELEPEEIIGSPFSIRSYLIPPHLGGEDALADLKHRMNERGLLLVLDFVANHMSKDCSWLDSHTEAFMQGRNSRTIEEDNFQLPSDDGKRIFIAYGRDPYFPGWPCTAQLDARSSTARQLLKGAIATVAAQCDGLQCNMAMLGLNDVFETTWSKEDGWYLPKNSADGELWKTLIRAAKSANPTIFLTAEAYWGQEWPLQNLGFDFTWDKILYDRLRDGEAKSIREHLQGEVAFQNKSVRFLETHFQDRAASTFSRPRHRAALAIMLSSPGMSMLSYGQLLGTRNRQPLTVAREPHDEFDRELAVVYEAMCRGFQHPAKMRGRWFPVDVGDFQQHEDVSALLTSAWFHPEHGFFVALINFGDMPLAPTIGFDLGYRESTYIHLEDRLGGPAFGCHPDQFKDEGLIVPMMPWGVKLLELHFS